MAGMQPQVLVAALVLCIVGTRAEVISLNTAAFDEHVRDNVHTLVQFFAPWCGHCKKLAPEYEKAASQLQPQNIKLAKIDATEEKELASKFNVKGFPTLIWFEEGKDMEFDGTKTAEGILEWVTSMIAPPVTEGAPRPAPSHRPQLTLYADAMLPGYLEAAKINRRKAEWYFIKSGVRYPKVVLTHKGEEPVELSTWSTPDKEMIVKFLTENLMPLWGSLDGNTFDKYMGDGKGLVWSLFPPEGAGMDAVVAKHRPMMQEVARKIKDRYHVTYTDTEKFKEAIDNMLSISKFPAIAVQKKAGDKKKYIYDGDMTPLQISQFIQDVDTGRVSPRLKTEAVPEPSDDPVKKIVGSTLKELVINSN